jgi:hypothetical protein
VLVSGLVMDRQSVVAASSNSPDEARRAVMPDVFRTIWVSRYGSVAIEVIRGTVYVDGCAVEPAQQPAESGQRPEVPLTDKTLES